MAIAVSTAVLNTWKKKLGARHILRVRYKRIYYDAAASPPAMAWESTWHTIPSDHIVSRGQIHNQLDIPHQNIFRIGELVIRVKNLNNEWIPNAYVPSIWASDESYDYQAYLTKFFVEFRYVLPDESVEWIPRFTGVLVKTPRITGRGAEAELTLAGMMHLVEESDAEDVSETFTEEPTVPPTADGSNAVFATTSDGVDHVSLVEMTDPAESPEVFAEVTQGDWEIADVNELKPAEITMADVPAAGADIRASGVKWKKNLSIENLLELIFQNAGFVAGEYDIDPVIFPGGLSGRKTIDSQAEWQAGTLFTNVDAETTPGSIVWKWNVVDDFADSNFSSSPTWTPLNYGGSIDATGGLLTLSNVSGDGAGYPLISLPYSRTTGAWKFNLIGNYGTLYFFMDSNAHYMGNPSGNGYGFWVTATAITLYRITGGTLAAALISAGADFTQPREVIVSRDSSGNFELWIDGVSRGTATDNSYTTSSYIMVGHTGGTGTSISIYDIYDSEPLSEAIYKSEIFDLLSTPTAFGKLLSTYELNGGAVTLETAAGASAGSLDAFVATAADGQIESTPGRFFQIQAKFTPADYVSSPEIKKLVANFTTSTVNVSLANHSGKKGLAAAERYVQIADYEIGGKADGTLFARSKAVSGAPAIELTQENGIVDVLEYDGGEDRIKNVGRVRYNEYFSEYDGASAGEAEPTSETRYRRRVLSEDYSDIMLANDVNLAASRARVIYENNYRPKRILKLKVWDIPWLELGDIARISYYDHPIMRQMIAGDPLNKWGSSFLSAGAAQNVIARDWDMKVIGWIPDLDDPGNCILTVEEILS